MNLEEFGVGALGIGLGVLGLLLVLFWVLFPILVWIALNKIQAELRIIIKEIRYNNLLADQSAKANGATAKSTERLAEFFSERNVKIGDE